MCIFSWTKNILVEKASYQDIGPDKPLFKSKSTDVFLLHENMLWVLSRSALLRHF